MVSNLVNYSFWSRIGQRISVFGQRIRIFIAWDIKTIFSIGKEIIKGTLMQF